jgi:hypothetical protein
MNYNASVFLVSFLKKVKKFFTIKKLFVSFFKKLFLYNYKFKKEELLWPP